MQLNPQISNFSINEILPDEVYDTSDNSHIVKLLKAFIGGGVGFHKNQYLLTMLNNSLATLAYDNIDKSFGLVLGIPRLVAESYSYDLSALTASGRAECWHKDSLYKARIFKYLQAMNIGCNVDGIKMMAEASTGRDCYVLEGDREFSIVIGNEPALSEYYSDTQTYNSTISLPEEPKRSGYVFLGWYTQPSGGVKLNDGDKVLSERPIRFYAHWEKINA